MQRKFKTSNNTLGGGYILLCTDNVQQKAACRQVTGLNSLPLLHIFEATLVQKSLKTSNNKLDGEFIRQRIILDTLN